MWAMTTSKYSLSPLNENLLRFVRTDRVGGGRCWCAGSGRDCGDSKRSESDSRRVNVERAVTIISGGMYPECGIS